MTKMMMPKQSRLFLKVVLFFMAVFVEAADVFAACNIYSPKPSLAFSYAKYAEYKIHSPSRITIDPSETSLEWQGQAWEANYNYLALDFPADFPDAPLTNGHLHDFSFGYAGKTKISSLRETDRIRWSILPTMAVSSNQLKNPETIEGESFRLDGYLAWEHIFKSNWSLVGGICLGALTGEYEIIPIFGINHRDTKWEVTLAYPQTQFQYALTSAVRMQADWSLLGNQWSVLDHDLEIRSDFNLASQQIKLGFSFTTPFIGDIELFWLYLFNQKMSYVARSGSRITVDTDNTSGWMIRYAYQL